MFAVALAFSASAFAQQQAAATEATGSNPETSLLDAAGTLVRYGHQTKTALPLIQAAEIYSKLGVTAEATPKAKTSEEAVGQGAGAEKANPVTFDPAQLLDEATQYAEGDKTLLAMINKVKGVRGRVPGPVRHTDRVNAHATDVYTITFRGGEDAYIVVSGDGDTDLDLYVYDENGNFITSDTDSTDDCVVRFHPRWTGPFRVKIKNLGGVYNNYVLITN